MPKYLTIEQKINNIQKRIDANKKWRQSDAYKLWYKNNRRYNTLYVKFYRLQKKFSDYQKKKTCICFDFML